MKVLHKRAFAGLLNLFVIVVAALFLSSGTLSYWQGWVFLGAFFLPALAITLDLMSRDPDLLERRVHGGALAEKEKSQKVIQAFAALAFLSILVVPALDHRFGWSTVPLSFVLTGDGLILLGFLFIFLVFKENTFTSGIIEVASEQRVISSGPYALVRHPMYSGGLIMLLGVPLSLGSWWGLLMFVPMLLVIVTRLLGEETFLLKNLSGYTEYRTKVRYRLAPFVW